MSRRKYSDVEKAEAIAAVKSNGGNIFRTSQELKIPWATLADWVKNNRGTNDHLPERVLELREQKEQELSELCESVARKYLKQAGDEYVVAAVPGNLAMTAAGIAIDKAQLLRGQPTEITAVADRTTFLRAELRRLRTTYVDDDAYASAVRQLKASFTDTTDPAYDPLLDWTKHPENWPAVEAGPSDASDADI